MTRESRVVPVAAALLALWQPQTPSVPPGRQIVSNPVVVTAGRHDVSPALRVIPPKPPRAEREPHAPLALRRPGPKRRQTDPARQTAAASAVAPNTIINFEGVNNVDAVLPPDTNGDIGPLHYVQWVNKTFAVYSRTGALLYGPASGSTIWSGFGGPCETQNDGDPIVLYDHLADRWFLSQFALPNNFFGLLVAPFYQCIAVSQTPDPTGAYHRYQFQFSKLNDYPKFGVWSDGYYMAINQFSSGSLQFAGQGVAAFDRAAMLAGRPATMIYFDLAGVDPALGGMLPSDLDGVPPPPGSPNYFVQMDDDGAGSPADRLQLWRFRADWTTPANSTFTGPVMLPVASFDSNLCGFSRSCIPQPGTAAKLDAIADRLMYRLQYRNFGTHESLVVNHTVDVDGSDHAGVRWYEVRNPATGPAIHQQGTYAPDAAHRWMASAAMDGAGNIALAYNVSGPALAPSIRYAARLATDAPGVLGYGENELITGSGSQTHSASRWGDYSMLGVDPTDDCTFWATAEYYVTTSPAGWQTRVGAFRLPGCGVPTDPPAAPSGLTASATSSTRIVLSWSDQSNNESGFSVERCSGDAAACTASGGFAQVGQTGAGVTTYADGSLAPNSTCSYRVRAFNSGGESAYSNIAAATTLPPPVITVSASVATAAEAGLAKGAFTLTRDTGQDSPLSVTLSVSGTATRGTDYIALPTSITIPAGSLSASIPVVPIDDTAIEGDETVVLTVTPSSAYTAGTPAAATVTIVSDELSRDLVVTALTVPASAAAGATILVSDTTKNQGADTSGESVTSFYLSANYVLDTADLLLGTRTVPDLASGGANSATTSLTLPAGLVPGSYVVFAKADGPDRVRETSELNNMRSASTKVGPDLVVSLTTPAAVGAGTPFAVTDSTSNQGAAPAGQSITRFYLSATYTLDASDIPLGERTATALDAGAASLATTMVTIPAGTTAGSYYVIAEADATHAVAEHTETNNTKYSLVRLGGDFIVNAFSAASPRAAAGSVITVTDTTKNNGAAAVDRSTTAFYLSSNPTLDAGDTRLQGARAIAPLAIGASSSGSTPVTLPLVLPGMWFLIANADDGNAVGESIEANNTRAITLAVGPDLIVSAMLSPATAAAGGTITVTDTVKNNGADTAAASFTRFYLSKNASLDAGDVLLEGMRAVGALAPGASDAGSTALVLPAVAGTYYIIAVADGAGAVAESSDTNNTLARLVTIGS